MDVLLSRAAGARPDDTLEAARGRQDAIAAFLSLIESIQYSAGIRLSNAASGAKYFVAAEQRVRRNYPGFEGVEFWHVLFAILAEGSTGQGGAALDTFYVHVGTVLSAMGAYSPLIAPIRDRVDRAYAAAQRGSPRGEAQHSPA